MNRPIRVVRRARADLEHIFDWLFTRSPQGADAWYVAFYSCRNRIADNPSGFANVAEATSRWKRAIHEAYFKTPRGRKYRVIFEWTHSEIIILRVRAPGQKLLRRRDLPASD